MLHKTTKTTMELGRVQTMLVKVQDHRIKEKQCSKNIYGATQGKNHLHAKMQHVAEPFQVFAKGINIGSVFMDPFYGDAIAVAILNAGRDPNSNNIKEVTNTEISNL
eukprot:15206_1